MKYIVKIGFIRSGDGYAYSIWIETDYGVVIDMWSDFIEDGDWNSVYENVFNDFIMKLRRILHEPSDIILYVDRNDFKEYINNLKKDALREINYLSSIVIESSKFEEEGRVYSLAKMALEKKGRYPPIL